MTSTSAFALFKLKFTYVFLHSIQNKRLKFVQTVVDASSSPLLHYRLITLQQRKLFVNNIAPKNYEHLNDP